MIAGQGRQGFAAELDVTVLSQIQPAVDQVVDRFGRIDILVNNAGYNFTQTPLEVTEEMWDAVYNTNVKGLFFVTQAVARVMVDQPVGAARSRARSSMLPLRPLLPPCPSGSPTAPARPPSYT